MPAAVRKTADAAPAVEAGDTVPAAPEPEAPVAEETPAVAAPAEPREPVTVTFTGQAQSSVARVGLVEPGEQKTVPAALADELCRGDAPVFVRACA